MTGGRGAVFSHPSVFVDPPDLAAYIPREKTARIPARRFGSFVGIEWEEDPWIFVG
jgi:hypothetical protein